MTTHPTEKTEETKTEARTTWHAAQDILCRFLSLYFLLYFPTHLFAAPVLNLFLGKPMAWITHAWDRLVPWVGEHVLYLSYPITIRPGGSGDTTYNYVQVLIIAVVALVGCLVWTLVDRKRPQERPLVRWILIACRYYLAFVLLTYGFAKVFKTQFPFPSLERLLQPYGESSPMALAWTFMGYSTTYNIFAGLGEVLAALLLFFRRTTTLGVLMSLAVMANVVVMNFSYDIPVKLFSSHLLLMAMVLLSIDLRRVLQVFVFNRETKASAMRPLFSTARGKKLHRISKTLVIVASLALTIEGELARPTMKYGDQEGAKTGFFGLYDVESFVLDGETRPPLTSDGERWQNMIVEYQGQMIVRLMDGTLKRYGFKPGPKAVWVHRFGDGGETKFLWSYAHPSPGILEIEGEIDGRLFSVRLNRRQRHDFLLVNRGFHWINEEPFNR